jgi:hypothetical protein
MSEIWELFRQTDWGTELYPWEHEWDLTAFYETILTVTSFSIMRENRTVQMHAIPYSTRSQSKRTDVFRTHIVPSLFCLQAKESMESRRMLLLLYRSHQAKESMNILWHVVPSLHCLQPKEWMKSAGMSLTEVIKRKNPWSSDDSRLIMKQKNQIMRREMLG